MGVGARGNPANGACGRASAVKRGTHLVTIYATTPTTDALGGRTSTRSQVDQAWAHVRTLKGSELERADRKEGTATHVIKFPDDVTLSTHHEVVVAPGTAYWEVTGVERIPGVRGVTAYAREEVA